jgi:hypothetical protein
VWLTNFNVSLCQRLLTMSTTKRFGFHFFRLHSVDKLFCLLFPYTTQRFETNAPFLWILSFHSMKDFFWNSLPLLYSLSLCPLNYGCFNFSVILCNNSMLTEKINSAFFYSFPCFQFWYLWNSDRFLILSSCWC